MHCPECNILLLWHLCEKEKGNGCSEDHKNTVAAILRRFFDMRDRNDVIAVAHEQHPTEHLCWWNRKAAAAREGP